MAAICNNVIATGLIKIPTKFEFKDSTICYNVNFNHIDKPTLNDYSYLFMQKKYGRKKTPHKTWAEKRAASFYLYNSFLKFIRENYVSFLHQFIGNNYTELMRVFEKCSGDCIITPHIGFFTKYGTPISIYTYIDDLSVYPQNFVYHLSEYFEKDLIDFISTNYLQFLERETRFDIATKEVSGQYDDFDGLFTAR